MDESLVFPAKRSEATYHLVTGLDNWVQKWHGMANLLRRLGLPIITGYIESSTQSTAGSVLITFGFQSSTSFAGLRSFLSASTGFASRWQESSYLSSCMLLGGSIVIAIVP